MKNPNTLDKVKARGIIQPAVKIQNDFAAKQIDNNRIKKAGRRVPVSRLKKIGKKLPKKYDFPKNP